MQITKYIISFLLALILSFTTSSFFTRLYDYFFEIRGDSFVDFSGLLGIPLSYIFYLSLLLTIIGREKKYWIMLFLLLPVLFVEFWVDLPHFYFPLALAFAGWLIGEGILKLVKFLRKTQ